MKETKSLRRNLLLIIFSIAVFLAYFLIGVSDYSGDVKNHVVWGESIVNLGTLNFYDRTFHDFAFPNYPPVAMLLFAASVIIYNFVVSLAWFLNSWLPIFPSNLVHFFLWENTKIDFLKLPATVSTVLLGDVIFLLLLDKLKQTKKALLITVLFFINPAVIYLSAVWGQIDILPLFFIVGAIYLLLKGKSSWAIVLAALSLLSKQTVLIYWVVFIIMLFKLNGIKSVIKALVISAVIFYLSYLPFHTLSLTWPLELYKLNFSLVAAATSVNSLNFWGAIFDYQSISDEIKILGITYQQMGYLTFGIFFAPLTFLFYKSKLTTESVFHYLFLITLIFFFVLTRMHERYLIPAIVFSAILLPYGKKYWLNFGFFSLLHFINLYRGLLVPEIPGLALLSNNLVFLDILVGAYGLLIIYNLITYIKLRRN